MDLREYLFKKDITVVKLGKISGLSPSTIRKVIKGKIPVTKKFTILIETVTGGEVTKKDLEKMPKTSKRIR